MRQPLKLYVERVTSGYYVAGDEKPFLSIRGHGTDRTTAVADYVANLIECYELIEKRSHNNRESANLLRNIQEFLVRG